MGLAFITDSRAITWSNVDCNTFGAVGDGFEWSSELGLDALWNVPSLVLS